MTGDELPILKKKTEELPVIKKTDELPVLKPKEGVMNRLNDLGSRFNRGVVDVVASIPEAIAVGAKGLNKLTGLDAEKPVEEYATYKLGQAIRKGTDFATNDIDPARDQEFIGKVFGGLGSAAAFAATLGTGGAVPALEAAAARTGVQVTKKAILEGGKALASPTGVIGGAVTAKGAFEEAKQAGLNDDQAFEVFAKNFPAGMTEAIPFTNIMKRINTFSGGGLVNYLKQAGTGGLEEGIQETLQKYWSNQVAKGTFDPERDPMLGLAEEGGTAFVVGALIPSLINAPGLSKELKNQLVNKLQNKAKSKVGLEATEAAPVEQKQVIDSDTEQIIKEITKPTETTESTPLTPASEGISTTKPNNDALQVESPESVPVREQSTTSEGVRQENTQEQTAAEKSAEESLTNLKEAHDEAYAEYVEYPTEESKNAFLKAQQDLNQATTEHKPSVKNPYSDRIRNIEKTADEEELISKARILINELPNNRELTAALINATGKNRNKTTFKNFIAALKDASNIPKKVVTNERTLFKDQIRNFAKGIRAGRLDEKTDRVNMIATLKDIIGKTKIPSHIQKSIINKLGSIDFKNTDKVIALAEYVDKVTNDTKFADRMSEIESLKDKVRGSYKNKLPVAQHKDVARLLEIDPVDLNDPSKYAGVIARLADNLQPVTKDKWGRAVEHKDIKDIAKEAGEEAALAKIRRGQQALIDELDSMEDTSGESIELPATKEEKEAEQKKRLKELAASIPRTSTLRKGMETSHQVMMDATPEMLDKLSNEDLKDYVRKLDQIVTNNDYSDTQNIVSKLELLRDDNIIPTLDRVLGPSSKSISSLSTGINYLMNQSKEFAGKFRAHTGLQDILDGDTRANTHFQDRIAKPIQDLKNKIEFGSAWKKIGSKILDVVGIHKTKVDLTTSNNEQLAKTYLEFNSRLEHLTPKEAFENAKFNLEKSIETLRTVGKTAEADLAEKTYSYFKGAKDLKEVQDTMKKLHPEVKQWVEGVQDIWRKSGIDEMAYDALESVEGEKPPKVEGYLPLGTKTENHIPISEDFKKRRDAITQNSDRIGSLQTRRDVIGDGAYRTGSFLNDITQSAKEALLFAYTAPGRTKLNNFQKLNTQLGYKWTGGKEESATDLFQFLKDRISDPQTVNYGEFASTAGSVVNMVNRLVYARVLGGPLQAIKQSVGIISTIGDFIVRGDIVLLFGNGKRTESAKELRNLHTIGGRYGNYAGLGTAYELQNNLKVLPNLGRIMEYVGRNVINLDELATATSNTTVKSFFGKADANLAERAWTASYLSYLKRNGVDVSNPDESFWNNEVKQKSDPIRKEAAAYAESYIGENFQYSNPVEAPDIAKKMPQVIRMMIPLVSYSVNKADSMQKSIATAADSKFGSQAQKDAVGNLTRNLIEQGSYALVTAYVAGYIKDFIVDTYRKYATKLDDPDEDDEERRKALRVRRAMYDAIKSLSGPILTGTNELWDYPVTESFNQYLYSQYKEDGQSYTEWLEDKRGKPIPNFKSEGVGDTGMFGMLNDLAGNNKDWWVDGVELKWKDEQGNEHSKELTDDQLSAFYNPMLKFMVGFAGSEFLGAMETAERQAVREAKSR